MRGIVTMAGGPMYFVNAYLNIQLLRRNGCTLPVEWFYLNPLEMPEDWIALAEALPGVTCVSLHKGATHNTKDLGGWQGKSDALCASSFDEILFLDADCFAWGDPTRLFEHPSYKKNGCVFWVDPPTWNAPQPRHAIEKKFGVRLPDKLIESGVMMFNRTQPNVEAALQCARQFNADHRDTYLYLYGDKDTFLVAALRCRAPHIICRHSYFAEKGLIHHDLDGHPFFWHGVGLDKWSEKCVGRSFLGSHLLPGVAFCRETLDRLVLDPRWLRGKKAVLAHKDVAHATEAPVEPITAFHTFVPGSDQLHHPLALWALSFAYARSHIGPVVLYATPRGHDLLAKIPYAERRVIEEREVPPVWRESPAVTKLLAYQRIDRPYVHLDGDVLLLKPLPTALRKLAWWYLYDEVTELKNCGCALPAQHLYTNPSVNQAYQERPHRHINSGLFGGTDWRALNQAAAIAVRAVHDAVATGAIRRDFLACPYEEFLTLHFLRQQLGDTLTLRSALEYNLRSGYLHLCAGKKNDPKMLAKVGTRLQLIAPDLYEIIQP